MGDALRAVKCCFSDLIRRAFDDWRKFAGETCVTELKRLGLAITRAIDNKQDVDRITANIRALVKPNEEVATITIDFPDYFLFALRYGFLDSALETIVQLTDPAGAGPQYFHPWFQPSLGPDSARLVVACQRRNAWLVRVSEFPGRFALTYRHIGGEPGSVLVTYITFHPLECDDRFSVELGDRDATAGDWPSMLYSVLKLNSRECIAFDELGCDAVVDGTTVVALAAFPYERPVGLDGAIPDACAIPLPLPRRACVKSE
jgi:hypothetical protein